MDGKTTTFAWLTNSNVDRDNAIIIARGGRTRWTIENEGFNEQKTGYESERFRDCKDLEVMTRLYPLLQVAHLFMQLLASSHLIEPVSTQTFLADLLLEALCNALPPGQLFDPNSPGFRFSSPEPPRTATRGRETPASYPACLLCAIVLTCSKGRLPP